jgi:hypothetical protein
VSVRRLMWWTWSVLTVLWICVCTWPLMLWVAGCFPNGGPACGYWSHDETIFELKMALLPPLKFLVLFLIADWILRRQRRKDSGLRT